MIMLHRETLFAEKGRACHIEYGLERHTEIIVGCDGMRPILRLSFKLTEAGFVRGWSIEVVPR